MNPPPPANSPLVSFGTGAAPDSVRDHLPPPAIRLESLSAGYGEGADVIAGAALELAAGATAIVQGSAGAGKSTLMHLLRGALPPRTGRVLLLGSDLATLPPRVRAALKRRIGYIAQTPLLLGDASALDNVVAPLTLAAGRAALSDATRADVADMLAYLGLTPAAHHLAGNLSHVQRRLLAIARAFVARPDIVLADEPLAGLGADAAGRVLRLLSEMARQRATVVIATHAPDMFAALPATRWRLEAGVLGAAPA